MAGVKHDSLADIELISDNLRDRYKTGFPILKEIVQNADDAGATHLSFGYSTGLLQAEHILLKGPAVFFINDGPLTSDDADAILRIALGSKASNQNAIGKFGLGMKSLFHLCEAFFYLSDQWTGGEAFHSNIFNPWGDDRAEWEYFDPKDKQLIENHLNQVIKAVNEKSKNLTWFLVWVPLRRRDLNNGDIISNYPGDEIEAPDFIVDKNIDVQLAQLLPMLKGLNSIQIWQTESGSSVEFQCTSSVTLNSGSIRRQFNAPIEQSQLTGNILIETKKGKNQIDYAGCEYLLPEDDFAYLKKSEFWPKSYERDRTTSKEKKVLDKAKPHTAIVICQKKAVQKASCHVDWAVFLPLGDYPQISSSDWVNSDDKWDTQVFIHGYFFIDAGRVHIHGFDRFGKNIETIETDDQLRTQWNSLLAMQGSLSYLPEAISNFVTEHRCGIERAKHLSEAIFKSPFAKQYKSWLSQRYQWVCQLTPTSKSWTLIPAKTKALPLYQYPKGEFDRPWSVFTHLVDLVDDGIAFYDQSEVALLSSNHDAWNDELLLEILKIDSHDIFTDQVKLAYFNNFLDLDEVWQTEPIKNRLKTIAKEVLKSPSRKLKSEISKFLAYIPQGQRISIKIESDNILWKVLSVIETGLLVIPKYFDPVELDSNAFLNIDDACMLLEALDQVLADIGKTKIHVEAQNVIEEIIGYVDKYEKERLLNKCSNFRLFKVHDLANGKDLFVSKSELNNFLNQKSLYRFTSGLNDEKFGVGIELHKAVKNCSIYFIDKKNRELVLGERDSLLECDGKACLQFITRRKPELKKVEERISLINLLSAIQPSSLEQTAFRYLLHGDVEHFDSNEGLLSIDTDLSSVWEKIAREIYTINHQSWRLIEQKLADVLSRELSNRLNVKTLHIKEILDALNNHFNQIAFQKLNIESVEREEILSKIDDEILWKKMPFHETTEGKLISITENCYLDSDLTILSSLKGKFDRVKRSSLPAIKRKQEELVKPLDVNALIQIILSNDNPHNFHQLILENLASIHIDEGLNKKLRGTNWLILNNGQTTKPEDVIDLPGLNDDIKRLTAECRSGFYTPDDICQNIKGHDAFKIVESLFARQQEGLETLFLMLGDSDSFAIGRLPFSIGELLDYAELTDGSLDELPGWKLLANSVVKELALSNLDTGNKSFVEPILKSLSSGTYIIIFNALANLHEGSNSGRQIKIIKLFNAYLSLFAYCSDAFSLVKRIKLLSQQNTWEPSEKLCYGVEGVDSTYLLDHEQARCLGNLINLSTDRQHVQSEQWIVNDPELLLQATPNNVKNYFKDWDGRIESDLIGFFVSLLGGHADMEKVAQGFLGNKSLEGVRASIDWQTKQGDGRDKVLFDGLDQHDAIKEMEFLISVEGGAPIQVESILKQPIKVDLSNRPNTIIVNHSFYSQYRVRFYLKKLDFNNFSENELLQILQRSSEFILTTIYEQKIDLNNVWTDLGESDQLDIEIARSLILDELPANLRQLSLGNDEIKKALQKYSNARSLKKEMEIKGSSTKKAKDEMDIALDKMQDLLMHDLATQKNTLSAIKNKIGTHQYQPDSVPFEIFQNADDAVCEYAEMQAFPASVDAPESTQLEAQQNQFHVLTDKGLLFVHWGRAINYFRGGEGFPGKERGFGRDLEKMLLLNTSDKNEENQVTGKFGLGFKSVYLISDKPRILSGRLGVEIFAAMLPQQLMEKNRLYLKGKVDSLTSNNRLPATVIELPLNEAIDLTRVLKKFNDYASLLVAFSRRIKTITFDQQNSYQWYEKIIFDEVPEIRLGMLRLESIWGTETNALKFVFDNGQLLFAFGPMGFRELPKQINKEDFPKVWVLAPTHDEASIGFLINAGFDVDMGRLQLAHESEKNRQIVKDIGASFVSALTKLEGILGGDWEIVQQKFGLSIDTTRYHWWASLWDVLIKSWIHKDSNKVHELVKQMLVCSSNSFISLLDHNKFLPNGLWGDYQSLVTTKSIKYCLKGVLAEEKFFTKVVDMLAIHCDAEELIHKDIQSALYKLTSSKQSERLLWPTFDLYTLAEKEFPDLHVSIEAAPRWSELISDDLLEELNKSEEKQKERDRLEKYLKKSMFLANDNQFKPVSELLDSQFSEEEEKLRADFAPDSVLLSRYYDQRAAAFFRFARPQMKASIEMLEKWTLVAADFDKQKGVLRYLLKGKLSEELADFLKAKLACTWLNMINKDSDHFSGWNRNDIAKVLFKLLPADNAFELFNKSNEPIVGPYPIEELDPNIVLNNVYNWWSQNKKQLLADFNKKTYPIGAFPELDNGENINRDGWLTLLLLGALHTVGRAKDVQHRDSIKYFKDHGWWNIFIQENPQDTPEQWMYVLDDYFNTQFHSVQYESWMMRFVTIYRFASWLDDYANIWLALSHHSSRFSLESVLNTANSPLHAGGGSYAPMLSRTLGIGANFILRELIRNNVLGKAAAIVSSEHCYVPTKRVRELMSQVGVKIDEEYAEIAQSKDIYDFIVKYLGKEKATFDLCFDIPFQFIARDPQLEQRLFSNTPLHSSEVKSSSASEMPDWAWDLTENPGYFINLVDQHGLPEPIVGYEILGEDGSVIFELELAWQEIKVGITLENDYQQVMTAQKLGWQIFEVDELEFEMIHFLSLFNQ